MKKKKYIMLRLFYNFFFLGSREVEFVFFVAQLGREIRRNMSILNIK